MSALPLHSYRLAVSPVFCHPGTVRFYSQFMAGVFNEFGMECVKLSLKIQFESFGHGSILCLFAYFSSHVAKTIRVHFHKG